jgi:adenylate cyclase class IV
LRIGKTIAVLKPSARKIKFYAMIEVEKKLAPSMESIARIKADAIFISSEMMNDVLFDYADFSLIRNDVWLRRRNDKFDLKISKNMNIPHRFLDVYDEIEGEFEICKTLGIKSIGGEDFIEVANLVTKREKYKLANISIDFDFTTSALDDFAYSIMEVELLVKHESDVPAASGKIAHFIDTYAIIDRPAVAKIIQYFREKKRHIFDLLQR